MIRKVKSSLFAKVFFITAAMLLCVFLLVYGLLAWLMPQTYSNRRNAALDVQAQVFILELEQVAFSDSGNLFEQFWRADQARSAKGGEGSGLGLYIVKYIVEAHGGTIRAENSGGLAFTIRLPRREDRIS